MIQLILNKTTPHFQLYLCLRLTSPNYAWKCPIEIVMKMCDHKLPIQWGITPNRQFLVSASLLSTSYVDVVTLDFYVTVVVLVKEWKRKIGKLEELGIDKRQKNILQSLAQPHIHPFNYDQSHFSLGPIWGEILAPMATISP